MFDRFFDLVLNFLELGKFWVVVRSYEQGVILRLGKFNRVIDPGLHWMLPLGVDVALTESVVMTTKSLGNLSTTTSDSRSVCFECIVTYEIADIQKSLLLVNRVEDAIIDACQGIVGTTVSSMTWADLMNADATTEKLSAACRKRGWRYGVKILTVMLAGVSVVRNIRLMGDHRPT